MRLIFGPTSVDRAAFYREIGRPLRILHRGHDVTHWCTFADDTPEDAYAVLLRRDAAGRPFFDHAAGHVAREVVTGDVVIEMQPA